jgi:hypothetical protein
VEWSTVSVCSTNMTTVDDIIELALFFEYEHMASGATTGRVNLAFFPKPQYQTPEVIEFLELATEAGIQPKPKRHISGGYEDQGWPWYSITFTVLNAAFWTALATTIRTFITRHRYKKVVISYSPHGARERVEVTGYSLAELETLLRSIAAAEEREHDASSNTDSSGSAGPTPLPPSSG